MTRGIALAMVLSALCAGAWAQGDSSAKKTLILTPGYSVVNNQAQYVSVKAKTKIEKKFQPVENLPVSVYLDGSDKDHLLGQVVTGPTGEARLAIPPAQQAAWKAGSSHTISAVAAANKDFDETKSDLTVAKARITLDTADARNLLVTVTQLNDKQQWTPVKGVELKIGVRRQASLLPISADDATYTTDSLGQVTAEFKRDSLAADIKGNLVVAAVVEENETLGSLSVEKTLPWGRYEKVESNYDKRTLYATRQKTPLWLLFMAYSIIIAVWGVILYLVKGVLRIKRIGTA